MSMSGKRVVIVGGTSGIGFATAVAALKDGASSVVVVSSRKERVERTVTALGKSAEGEVADMSNEAQVKLLFARIGAFDHLVYTAGESLRLAPLGEMDFGKARGFLDIRFWGAFTAAKYAAPYIRAGGSITLTNGVAGLRPQKGWTLAASICGAMEALTRALAVELQPIRVNAVCPGFVKTELWGDMDAAQREAMFENMAQQLPVKRMGEAEDLAETYLYLMRERYSTGQVIVVDGGGVLV